MSSNQSSVKHNKHRIHPCPEDQKLDLLALLVDQNSTLKIIVAATQKSELIKEAIKAENVAVYDDEELMSQSALFCDLLISYDLPSTGAVYMSRLSHAKESALILLDISEQKNLYPIETMLGRAIRQEALEGFAYAPQQKMKIAPKQPKKQKSEYAFDANSGEKPKYEKKEKSERKPFSKPKFDKKPFEKPKYEKPKRDGEKSERKPFEKPKYEKPKKEGEAKDQKSYKKPNKFLGKDENGKAKFSGKSGERNHRYDGKPKEAAEAPKNIGRKITIKERKPKKDAEPNS